MKPETRKFLLNHPFLLGENEEGEDVYMDEDEHMFKVLGSMLEEYAATHQEDDPSQFKYECASCKANQEGGDIGYDDLMDYIKKRWEQIEPNVTRQPIDGFQVYRTGVEDGVELSRREGGECYVEVKCSDELPTEEGPYYVKMKAINQGMAHPVIFGRHDIYIWDDRPETAEIWVNSFESWLKKATIPKISEGRLEQIVDILVEHIAPTEQEIEFVNDEGFFLYNKRILEIATQLMKGGEG